jgi:hypothetical protein
VALRWRDVDFAGRKIVVRRALSAETELKSTKSLSARGVPLPDQAATALDRLSRRSEFTAPDDYVFADRFGRRLDPLALRRRFERARDAAGLEPLRFHDLRHTYGSLLVAGGTPAERQGRHGPLPPLDHRALPACSVGRRAGRSVHAGAVGRAARRGMNKPELPRTISDPDGRVIEFTELSWHHIDTRRPELLEDLRPILAAIEAPDYRQKDRIVGRERFYLRHVAEKVRWMTVVVDFNSDPAVVVTAFIQRRNPVRDR